MSAWILGSEVAVSLGLRGFEFWQEYVAKGFAPYNHEGRPFMPAAVVEQFIQRLDQELNQHDELAWNLGGLEREEIIAKYIEPLQRRIEFYRNYSQALNGSAWDGFEFPQDQDLSRHFIHVLLSSYYRRDEFFERLSPQSKPSPDQEPLHPAQVADQDQEAVKSRKLKTVQRRRIHPVVVKKASKKK